MRTLAALILVLVLLFIVAGSAIAAATLPVGIGFWLGCVAAVALVAGLEAVGDLWAAA